jgi:hypothetical protein
VINFSVFLLLVATKLTPIAGANGQPSVFGQWNQPQQIASTLAVVFLLGGLSTLGYQFFQWLEYASWPPLPTSPRFGLAGHWPAQRDLGDISNGA